MHAAAGMIPVLVGHVIEDVEEQGSGGSELRGTEIGRVGDLNPRHSVTLPPSLDIDQRADHYLNSGVGGLGNPRMVKVVGREGSYGAASRTVPRATVGAAGLIA